MENTTGFRLITYRFRLYCDRKDWILKTEQKYNEVLQFYYEIMQKEQGLKALNKLKVMRHLEIISIGTKDDTEIKYPVSFGKVPLYFRRAAINDAIRLYRSYDSGKDQGVRPAGSFHASPIYYKGMYKDFTESSISLKLYDGERWNWISCGVDTCGRSIKNVEKVYSPLIKIEGTRIMLHVTVEERVEDIRTVQERLEAEEKICAIAFPGSDCMAVLVLLSAKGEFLGSRFIRGGKELLHRKRQLLRKIDENRACMGKTREELPKDENKYYKEKIHRLTEEAAHKTSREIVNFCKEQEVSIIVVPNYKQALNLNQLGYLSASNYDWLGRRIITYLKYKAFGAGIVTATVSSKDIASRCYRCGEKIKKYNKDFRPGTNYYGGKNFVCPNGHQGNSYFNSAMNVGNRFLKEKKSSFEETTEQTEHEELFT